MKRLNLFAALFFSCLSLTAWADAGSLQSANGVVQINGQQQSTGASIEAGDVITTLEASSATIAFSDGSILDLSASSTLSVRKYAFDAGNSAANVQELELVDGTLNFESGKIADIDNTDVSIYAGSLVTTIDGTILEITWDQTANTFSIKSSQGTLFVHVWSVDTQGTPTFLSQVLPNSGFKATGVAENPVEGQRLRFYPFVGTGFDPFISVVFRNGKWQVPESVSGSGSSVTFTVVNPVVTPGDTFNQASGNTVTDDS